MVKMIIWRAFAGACRPNVAHFSVTPGTATVVFPPYSVSQENDKNKQNFPCTFPVPGAHVLSLGN